MPLTSVPFTADPSISISTIGPLRIEIPGAAFFGTGFALSIALSRLFGTMTSDLLAGPIRRNSLLVLNDQTDICEPESGLSKKLVRSSVRLIM